jgi:hypothetical protein
MANRTLHARHFGSTTRLRRDSVIQRGQLLAYIIKRKETTVRYLVYDRRNGFDCRAQLLLNLVKVESIIIRNKVDCQTKMTKSTRSTNSMKVGFCILGKVKVDNHVYRLNIDTTSEKI